MKKLSVLLLVLIIGVSSVFCGNSMKYSFDTLADGVQEKAGYEIPYNEDGAKLAKKNKEIRFYFMSGEKLVISNDEYAQRWGDACVVFFPNGETMVIDSARGVYIQYVIKNLKTLGVKTIDYYVQSHLHNDHYGALLSSTDGLFENFTVKNVYYNGCSAASSANDKLLAKCKKYGITPVILNKGDSLDIGKVHIDIFNPTTDTEGQFDMGGSDEVLNNTSMGMKFTYGSFKAIFSGDLYAYQEEKIVKTYAVEDPDFFKDITLIKTNHHGRDTSNSKTWAEALSPVIAVTTRGEGVDTDVYRNYARYGAHVFGDYMDGYVRVVSDGNKYTNTTTSRARKIKTFDASDKMAKTVKPEWWQ